MAWVKQYDPTRLVDAPSGGNDFPAGDIYDLHAYPGPAAPPALTDRVAVLGEFGGLGLPLSGHLWQKDKNWGYRGYKTRRDLNDAYVALIERLIPLVRSRVAGAIYTQTSDVEIEVNGFMTYDRRIVKLDVDRVAAIHRKLYEPIRPLSAAQIADVYTVAWWRFEDGSGGELVPHDRSAREGVAARDVSGHNNHLYAHGRANAPRHGRDVPAAKLPQTGAANRGSLDDSAAPEGNATRDLYTDPGRSRARVTLNSYQFSQWTVEASFRLAALGQDHGLVGKDGRPTDGPQAPLQLFVRAEDDRITIEAVDAKRMCRRVTSLAPAKADRWYHVAATSDGEKLRLLVDSGDGRGYQLQGETQFAGPLVNTIGTWTVGRGFHNDKISRDARAVVDEIRISSKALAKDRLLFATPKGAAAGRSPR